MAQQLWHLIKTTVSEWSQDNAARLAAALAYYTVFSIAPLLIIAIAVAGLAFGREAAEGEIVAQLRSLVGQSGAELIQAMIQSASQPAAGVLATVIGLATLLFGATGVFGELQSALNTIWNVQPKPVNGVIAFVRTRFLSLTLVLGIGFLLLVSLVLSAVLAGISTWVRGYVGDIAVIAQAINLALGFGVITLLFAMIYKLLPDLSVAWSDVWVGAVITALLFSVGRLLIGLYLGNSSVASTYGAAGSLVVVLVWVYYSAQILFLGAEFTQVYARTYGSRRHEQYLLVSDSPAPAAPAQAAPQRQRITQPDGQALKVPAPLVWLGTAALVVIGVVQALQDDRR